MFLCCKSVHGEASCQRPVLLPSSRVKPVATADPTATCWQKRPVKYLTSLRPIVTVTSVMMISPLNAILARTFSAVKPKKCGRESGRWSVASKKYRTWVTTLFTSCWTGRCWWCAAMPTPCRRTTIPVSTAVDSWQAKMAAAGLLPVPTTAFHGILMGLCVISPVSGISLTWKSAI